MDIHRILPNGTVVTNNPKKIYRLSEVLPADLESIAKGHEEWPNRDRFEKKDNVNLK